MEQTHPTHRAVTRAGVLASVGFGILCGALAWYGDAVAKSRALVLWGGCGFCLGGVAFMIWMIFRCCFLRCPACGRWLRNWRYSEPGQGKRFPCEPCGILWNSQIVEDGTG